MGAKEILYDVTIRGVSPLLIHAFRGPSLSVPTVKKKEINPEEECRKALYLSSSDKEIIPRDNIISCLKAAGRDVVLSGRKKISTLKNSVLTAYFSILEDEIEIVSSQGWVVDSRPVTNPTTGGKIIAYRPKFPDWTLNFPVCFVENNRRGITLDMIKELFEIGGAEIGIGAYRVSNGGYFGKFETLTFTRRRA